MRPDLFDSLGQSREAENTLTRFSATPQEFMAGKLFYTASA
jgi:hypothetical protein